MNRKEQQFLRQRQTTRQLMGVTRLTEHGAVCGRDELLFYLLRPDNLSILSPKGIRGRVRALTGLLQGMASLELLALDFAIDELGLYLTTHAQDQEALQLYWSYIKLAKEGREKYQKMYGPLLQTDLTPEDGFAWLKDPWPWEEGGND